MRLLSVLLLALLVVACQPQEPNKLKVYQKAKSADINSLEVAFEQEVAQQKEVEKNSLSANSLQAKKSLKFAINSLGTRENIVLEDSTSMIVKNGAIQINARDYQKVYDTIEKLKDKLQFDIVTEQQTTSDFNIENTLKIVANPADFDEIMKSCRNMATIIRKKYIWQQDVNKNYLKTQSEIQSQSAALVSLKEEFRSGKSIAERLLVQEKITATNGLLNLQVMEAEGLIVDKIRSTITLSVLEEQELVKVSSKPFQASFSSNIMIGWANFKVFLLQAALYWPYLLIGAIFLLTGLLASASSKRRTRKFRIKALEAQQKMNIQQK